MIMQLKNYKILFLENNRNIALQIDSLLKDRVDTIYFADSIDKMLSICNKNRPEIVSININMEKFLHTDIIEIIGYLKIDQPIILYSTKKNFNIFSKNFNKPKEYLNGSDGEKIEKLFYYLKKIPLRIHKKLNFDNIDKRNINEDDFDPTTGLCNRNKIYDILTKSINRNHRFGEKFCIMVISIDNFLSIKNTFGEKLYKDILIETSNIATQNSRIVDIVGRWKNDDFIIILPEASKSSAATMAENLRKSIQEHRYKKIGKLLTASIGVTQCLSSDDIEDIVKKVDFALCKAKKGGKNRVCIY